MFSEKPIIAVPFRIVSFRKFEQRKNCQSGERCFMNWRCCIEKSVENTVFFPLRETEDYVDVYSLQPKQINWGYGPTFAQNFFRILKDESYKIYITNFSSQKLDFLTMAHLIQNNMINDTNEDILIPIRGETKIELIADDDEEHPMNKCAVCFEKNKEEFVFVSCCNRIDCCSDCARRTKKCTICQKSYGFEDFNRVRGFIVQKASKKIPLFTQSIMENKKKEKDDKKEDKKKKRKINNINSKIVVKRSKNKK